MKVLSVVGARPQFIKAFAVSKELRKEHEEILVHTGQHYDEELSDVFFEELGIPEPDYNLGVGSDSHGHQTAEMIKGIEGVIEAESPDIILLYGDTNSTLAGAIAGSKMGPLLAHVEAGLRSHNREMPEEINRVLTDHASDLLFAPSKASMKSLKLEGITEGVHVVGDVMYDAILQVRNISLSESSTLSCLDVEDGGFLLSTIHRECNTDDPVALRSIINGLASAELPVIVPLHPRTEGRLHEFDLWEKAEQSLHLINPVGYIEFVRLLVGAEKVITDSGGVQKEAFFLNTPCITLRDETEWTETVDSGGNTLVGTDSDRIEEAIHRPVNSTSDRFPYGNGEASAKIVEILGDAEKYI